MSFITELKRRKVMQVTATYLVIAWLIMQILDVVAEPLMLPDWFARAVILLLGIGLPITAILSWAFDITPEGVVRDDGSGATTRGGGGPIDYALLGLLALAGCYMVFDYFVLERTPDAEMMVMQPVEVTPTAVAEEPALLPNSVAVLPFENLSLDPEDAFFAAGIHEEVLNQLVKLSALNVIARTTMIRYGDSGKSIPEVADELNVETVMEGSVRYADGRVLVTAQLIDPETNLHLWSDSYNRELADIFGVQADIAMNIANALEAEFSEEEQARIKNVPTQSTEAWTAYLRYIQSRTTGAGDVSLLDQAIELDPEFALGYAARATRRVASIPVGAGNAEDLAQLSRADLERALELVPDLAAAYTALAQLENFAWRRGAANAAISRALALSPNDPQSLSVAAWVVMDSDPEEAVRLAELSVALNPQDSQLRGYLGALYSVLGDFEAAAATYRTASALAPNRAPNYSSLAFAELRLGNPEAASEALQRYYEVRQANFDTAGPIIGLPILAHTHSGLGQPEEAEQAIADLRQRAGHQDVPAGIWSITHVALGEYETALEYLETAIEEREYLNGGLLYLRFNSFQDPVLDSDPRWVEARSRIWPRDE